MTNPAGSTLTACTEGGRPTSGIHVYSRLGRGGTGGIQTQPRNGGYVHGEGDTRRHTHAYAHTLSHNTHTHIHAMVLHEHLKAAVFE